MGNLLIAVSSVDMCGLANNHESVQMLKYSFFNLYLVQDKNKQHYLVEKKVLFKV